jgi:hypothetical protein
MVSNAGSRVVFGDGLDEVDLDDRLSRVARRHGHPGLSVLGDADVSGVIASWSRRLGALPSLRFGDVSSASLHAVQAFDDVSPFPDDDR